jgi:hypothetical protein
MHRHTLGAPLRDRCRSTVGQWGFKCLDGQDGDDADIEGISDEIGEKLLCGVE